MYSICHFRTAGAGDMQKRPYSELYHAERK